MHGQNHIKSYIRLGEPQYRSGRRREKLSFCSFWESNPIPTSISL